MSAIPSAFGDLGSTSFEGVDLAAGSADPKSFLAAARADAVVISAQQLALIAVRGPDAGDFLHRLSSQDCTGMAVGHGAPACFLTGKGKLLFDVRIWRPEPETFLIEVDRHRCAALLELLDRFLFAEKIEFDDLTRLSCIAIVGPNAPDRIDGAPEPDRVTASTDDVLVCDDALGLICVRRFAGVEALDALLARLDLPRGGFPDWEALRIEAGRPRYGIDADEATIPLEIGLDRACHTDKGCYVGQEVIARIHTYGHVNRKLVPVVVEADSAPAPGTLVYDDDLEAGRTTSAYVSPEDGKVHALALLPLVVLEEAPELRLGAPDGSVVRLRD